MATRTVRELMRDARDPDFWRGVVPGLRIGSPRADAWRVANEVAGERARLRDAGYARLERVLPTELTRGLATGVRSLHDASIPTVALYVFDEAWEVAAGLGPTLQGLLGAPPRMLPDVWAWFVSSRGRGSGWAPHRGVTFDVRDANGAPTLVNVWVALSDVTEESACMHLVPLPSDPSFPAALERIDIPASSAIALPVPAGSVLAWNANVLHWGGRVEPGAQPRLSASFSFRTIVTAGDRMPTEPPTFEERVDLLADMLVAYAPIAEVAGPWLEWARLWRGMREARR